MEIVSINLMSKNQFRRQRNKRCRQLPKQFKKNKMKNNTTIVALTQDELKFLTLKHPAKEEHQENGLSGLDPHVKYLMRVSRSMPDNGLKRLRLHPIEVALAYLHSLEVSFILDNEKVRERLNYLSIALGEDLADKIRCCIMEIQSKINSN
jgi:hypothetical protein